MTYGANEFELLKKFNFIRPSGTDEEKRAASILCDEIKKIGYEPYLEPFTVDFWNIKKASLTAPNGRSWEVTGYGMAGSTPETGITAPFKYVQDATDVDLYDAAGKIVLVGGNVTDTVYKRLIDAKVAGFIAFSGNVADDRARTDLALCYLHDHSYRHGKLPGVNMRAEDALDLVNTYPETVTLTLVQEETTAVSNNVIAEVKGTDPRGEKLIFSAHYDSVPFSHGVYDNGGGTVIIMELLRHFKAFPPKRDLKFVWFGSEERGVQGSKAYVAAHQEEMKDIVLMINIDMAGFVLGRDAVDVTAEMGLYYMIEFLSKEKGFPLDIQQGTYPGDSIPFADAGVPSINFSRGGRGSNIHNRYDIIDYLAPKNLDDTTRFILTFCDRLVDSAVFPVPHTIPEDIIKKVDRALRKEQ